MATADQVRVLMATTGFFATVPNRLYWAIHGHTTAEAIVDRAEATLEYMGLHPRPDAPHGKVHQLDALVANYPAASAGEFLVADGVLPWGLVESRPFLRCVDGLSRALLGCDRREDAAAALRRLLRRDPADPLGAGARRAAITAGRTWREQETAT